MSANSVIEAKSFNKFLDQRIKKSLNAVELMLRCNFLIVSIYIFKKRKKVIYAELL